MKIAAEEAIAIRSIYKPDESNEDIRVYLDGNECKDVVTADEDSGFVVQADRDKNGLIFAIGNEIATKRRDGVVRIVLPSWWPR